MAMSTATGGPILTPAQVHALVIQPLIGSPSLRK